MELSWRSNWKSTVKRHSKARGRAKCSTHTEWLLCLLSRVFPLSAVSISIACKRKQKHNEYARVNIFWLIFNTSRLLSNGSEVLHLQLLRHLFAIPVRRIFRSLRYPWSGTKWLHVSSRCKVLHQAHWALRRFVIKFTCKRKLELKWEWKTNIGSGNA